MRNILVLARGVFKELIRRKDFYFILALLIVIVLYSSSLSFGREGGFSRYFKEIGISFTYIFSVIIAVTFAARQIPQEIEAKTVYPILAHPVSRGQFIMGKFCGVFFISAASFTVFYAVFMGSLFLKKDLSTPMLLMLEGYILHIFLLSFFVSLVILLSLFLSTAANAAVSLILYFASEWFGISVKGHLFLPHPEFFDIKEKIIHTRDIIPAWVMLFLTIYAVLYTALFLTSAYLAFRRRDL